MNFGALGTALVGISAGSYAWRQTGLARILHSNKTRQGYARERILKPAGYFFVRRVSAGQGRFGSASWQR